MSSPELAPVRCPYCGALWDRREVARDQALHEIRCRCRRLIAYRVGLDGVPVVERAGE